MMRSLGRSLVVAVAAAVLSLSLSPLASAQTTTTASSAGASTGDRLFLGFAEDSVLADRQWWEPQFEYADGSADIPWDAMIVRIVGAVRPRANLELGGRVGFGDTDASPGIPDGTGATDADLWAKWHFGTHEGADFAVGAIATVPTGDEASGLGFDAFAVKLFGSFRYPLARAVFAANVGFRFNGDGHMGDPFGPDLDGKTSASVGLGLIVPLSSAVSLVGETEVETERFDGLDSDVRVLAGINWRPSGRGIVRAGVGLGLSDAVPDLQLLAGYAFQF